MTSNDSKVVEFYKNSKILITGGTGFVGKLLVEKLLRICASIDQIYLIIRVKKDKEPSTRLKELMQDPVFQRLQKEKPDFQSKITCIPGDCSTANLGISETDRQLLTREITHIFHAAATVRFDEPLRLAVSINVRGTQEMVKLCKDCVNLKVAIHVSTAYSNCHFDTVREAFYDSPLNGDNAVKLIEIFDDAQLDNMKTSIIGPWPNTYSFTKAIAENVVQNQGQGLPIAVFRPSIILATNEEPTGGFVDNLYGPAGVCAAIGSGLMRVLRMDSSREADMVPADFVVNALICAAWDTSYHFNNNNNNNNNDTDNDNNNSVLGNGLKTAEFEYSPTKSPLPIYNCVSSPDNPITWEEYIEYTLRHGMMTPTIKSIWYYSITLTKIKLWYNILAFMLHILPALAMDGCLRLAGKKPQMYRIYQKVHKLNDVLAFFTVRSWKFEDKSLQRLWTKLSTTDRQLFNFDARTINWDDFCRKQVSGIRKYIFQDDPSTVPAARKKMFLLHIAHRIVQFCFFGFCFWTLRSLYTMIISVPDGTSRQFPLSG